MTESEWLASTDVAAMLHVVQGPEPHYGGFATRKISPRKLRLFAVALCRQPEVWDGKMCGECEGTGKELSSHYGDSPVGSTAVVVTRRVPIMNVNCPDCHGTGRIGGLIDPRSRNAVEVAERFADGLATEEELEEARTIAASVDQPTNDVRRIMAFVVCNRNNTAHNLFANAAGVLKVVPPATQANLLRCIVGNPWRPPWVKYTCEEQHMGWRDPESIWKVHDLRPWLTHNDSAAAKLAEAAYQSRFSDPAMVLMLSDALLEAGCPESEVCVRCRGRGMFHVGIKGGPERGPKKKYIVPPTDTHPCRACNGTGRIPHPLVAHLRGKGPFVRGDWVVDLLTGRS